MDNRPQGQEDTLRAPKVGELRIYNGEPEVLYPGEWAQVDAAGLCTVSPEPGLRALLLRVRYRLIGRFDEWRAARKERSDE